MYAIELEYDLMCNKFYRVWETADVNGKAVSRPVSQEFGEYSEAQAWLVEQFIRPLAPLLAENLRDFVVYGKCYMPEPK